MCSHNKPVRHLDTSALVVLLNKTIMSLFHQLVNCIVVELINQLWLQWLLPLFFKLNHNSLRLFSLILLFDLLFCSRLDFLLILFGFLEE